MPASAFPTFEFSLNGVADKIRSGFSKRLRCIDPTEPFRMGSLPPSC